MSTAELKADLETVGSSRILFGHQSVGRNILAGLASLAGECGVSIRIAEITTVPPDSGPGLFHSNIGKNGDPQSKCDAFESLLMRPERPAYDLAVMKFCYVDLGRSTPLDAEAMAACYARLVEVIAKQRPDIRLMHMTMPLRAEWTGWKVRVNRLLGRDIPVDTENAMRNAFNDALRDRYGSELFFDLAALESTRADGSRSSFQFKGRTVYSLAHEYTHDGGHLNPAGQRWVAAAFVRALAKALRERPAERAATAAAAQ